MRSLLVLLLMTGAALAHGDAAWIQEDPQYRDKDNPGVHCCGVNDCHPAEPGSVEYVPGGYRVKVTGEVIPEHKTYFTRPDKLELAEFWYCLRHTDPVRVRCLFVPGGAT